jgi:tRNA (mo5U34)-methyltransferase
LNSENLSQQLTQIGLTHWVAPVQRMIDERLNISAHGDYGRWSEVIRALADGENSSTAVRELLLQLSPWRKGPFDIGGVHIDTEWRSDMKWARMADKIAPLAGRTVLDVGSGNGYYALQMREAGAGCVIGVDPTLLFVMQFLAVNHFKRDARVFVLPARLHELPLPAKQFDTTFSMGVLYHQRAPVDHLRQLRQTLRAGGQLVLETIYLPGDESCACTPEDRYARMRNVWLLPTIAELTTWLRRSGYTEINVIDRSVTTTDEQRATEWMTFESLSEALDPADPGRTVEGWPAPHRVIVTATSP